MGCSLWGIGQPLDAAFQSLNVFFDANALEQRQCALQVCQCFFGLPCDGRRNVLGVNGIHARQQCIGDSLVQLGAGLVWGVGFIGQRLDLGKHSDGVLGVLRQLAGQVAA